MQSERIETHSAAILFASVVRTEKQRGKESKHCPDPSETVDKYIKNEFPDKIVAIKLDLITKQKQAHREIALTVQTICVLS